MIKIHYSTIGYSSLNIYPIFYFGLYDEVLCNVMK